MLLVLSFTNPRKRFVYTVTKEQDGKQETYSILKDLMNFGQAPKCIKILLGETNFTSFIIEGAKR